MMPQGIGEPEGLCFLQVQDFLPLSMTPQGIGEPEGLCFWLIFSQCLEAKLEEVKGLACSVSIRGQRAVFSSCQILPGGTRGSGRKAFNSLGEKHLGKCFFVSFSGHLISFLCFIYSFPGRGRCASHHKDINTPSRAFEGKQPGMETSSGIGAGWREPERENFTAVEESTEISQGRLTVQSNDPFY